MPKAREDYVIYVIKDQHGAIHGAWRLKKSAKKYAKEVLGKLEWEIVGLTLTD